MAEPVDDGAAAAAGPSAEPVFWGKKWHEGGFEKNQIHFEKTAKVMRDIFDATHGFQKELGSHYTFLDIACAPGGFSRFLCSDPRCQRGWGISLPVTEGGFRLLFTWTHPDERKFQVKFRDMLTLEPEDCCEHQVDLVISDAQYLPLRKADQPGPDPALAKSQSVNPALGIWALLFQQLRLGLCNLRNGGVMMFRLNCKDGNVDWYFDCVSQVLALIDRLFESVLLFKSGKSHQSDGTAYLICRGFCRCEFEAMQGAEILRKSIMVSRYEHEVAALGMSPMFRKITTTREIRARTRELFSMVDDAITRYKEQEGFAYGSTVREWRCVRSVPALRRQVRSNMGTVMPMVASRVAQKHLEATIREMDVLTETLSSAGSLEAVHELAAKCQEAKEKLQQRATELEQVITAAHETSINLSEIEGEEFNAGIEKEDGWARTAEPEAESSEYLHVTGLLQGIEESTLQKCFGRLGKVEEIRFLPQDQAMASRCAALVKMSTAAEAKVARDKLDGVIPEGTGFEMERTLMITFQVKNGIQVCDHLFVRGIPSAVQKHQIVSLFNCYGQVLWSSILPQRLGEEDRCALVQMASSDEAQNAIQALNWSSSSALMPTMMVRYAGAKVFAALRQTELHDEGEGSEEDEDFAHFGVIDEAPKPAFQPLKERPQEMGSRWKKHEEEDWDGPEGTRLWGWAMQPVKEATKEDFPELGPSEAKVEAEPETWEDLGDDEPSEVLCMKDPPSGLPDSVMQMWFKPYGHVMEMWPLEGEEEVDSSVSFLVHMSCVEEAINAYNSLNGKSIMRGCPLNLSYWHGPIDRTPATPAPAAVDSHRLLAAARLLASKKEVFEEAAPEAAPAPPSEPAQASRFLRLHDPPDFPESVMQIWFKPYGTLVDMKRQPQSSGDSGTEFLVQMSSEEEAVKAHDALNGKCLMGKSLSLTYWQSDASLNGTSKTAAPSTSAVAACPAPGVGIDDQQLLDACKAALAERQRKLQQPMAVPAVPGDVESWEDLEDDASAPAEDAATPCDALCISGVPPGIQEMVMQFWFKPYGQVTGLRPLLAREVGHSTPCFLVNMSSVEEATKAKAALDGKPVMKGSPLIVRYWHG